MGKRVIGISSFVFGECRQRWIWREKKNEVDVRSGSEEGRVAHLSQVFDGMIQMRREEDGEFMEKEKKGIHSSGAERA
jgi:hypothetical protein